MFLNVIGFQQTVNDGHFHYKTSWGCSRLAKMLGYYSPIFNYALIYNERGKLVHLR